MYLYYLYLLVKVVCQVARLPGCAKVGEVQGQGQGQSYFTTIYLIFGIINLDNLR